MNNKLHFYYHWNQLDGFLFRNAVREFLDNGAERFVISAGLLEQMIRNPERKAFLHQVCRDMHVQFSAVHAMYGRTYDLNIPEMERRPAMVQDHILGMQTAVEFGCKVYVIHVGAAHYCHDQVTMDILRPLALDTLEKLLPHAEKLGMIIAVENSFEVPNSAKEVLGLVQQFSASPAIGVCFDTGHANCMSSMPDKEKAKYRSYFHRGWWENGIIWEDNAIELLKDHIVTCHIHDNDGYGDLHGMPFDGNINWEKMMQDLRSCPRMMEYQTEVTFEEGTNWAGELLSPPGGYSIRRLSDTFRKLGF